MARTHSRGVTKTELLVGISAVGLLTLVAGWWGEAATESNARAEAVSTAKTLLSAASDWKREHGDLGCPTISQLIVDAHLTPSDRADDPWGQKFRIKCDARSVEVLSPGLDGRFRTADDIALLSNNS